MIDLFLAAPTANDALRQMFIDACNTPSSINEHLTVMRDTASGLSHITEFGVGDGWSTLAWLIVQPEKLVLYDLGWQECMTRLLPNRGKTEIRFFVGDARLVTIEETELLFIDTIHTYDHLKEELRLHADKATKYLIFHDTTTFGDEGEDRKRPGLWQAVCELIGEGKWRIASRFTHNNGLTILKRR